MSNNCRPKSCLVKKKKRKKNWKTPESSNKEYLTKERRRRSLFPSQSIKLIMWHNLSETCKSSINAIAISVLLPLHTLSHFYPLSARRIQRVDSAVSIQPAILFSSPSDATVLNSPESGGKRQEEHKGREREGEFWFPPRKNGSVSQGVREPIRNALTTRCQRFRARFRRNVGTCAYPTRNHVRREIELVVPQGREGGLSIERARGSQVRFSAD